MRPAEFRQGTRPGLIPENRVSFVAWVGLRSVLLDLVPASEDMLDAEILGIWDFGQRCFFDDGVRSLVAFDLGRLVGRVAR